MFMRVISGAAKGRRLLSLESGDIRPTTDRVKEAVFSSIQFELEGRRFLDLFAGSGQMGIEALSRGAESALFVDSSERSIKVINENIRSTGFEKKARVVRSDALSFLNSSRDTFDIAFLDPPYYGDLLNKALILVSERMSFYGTVICEHPPEVSLPERVGEFTVHKKYRYGKIFVTAYKKDNINEG